MPKTDNELIQELLKCFRLDSDDNLLWCFIEDTPLSDIVPAKINSRLVELFKEKIK